MNTAQRSRNRVGVRLRYGANQDTRSSSAYSIGQVPSATLALAGNTLPVRSLKVGASGATLTWSSTSNRLYRVAFKNNLTDPTWTVAGNLTATNSNSSWVVTGAGSVSAPLLSHSTGELKHRWKWFAREPNGVRA